MWPQHVTLCLSGPLLADLRHGLVTMTPTLFRTHGTSFPLCVLRSHSAECQSGKDPCMHIGEMQGSSRARVLERN